MLTTNIDDFVKQNNNLKVIQKKLPSIKNKVSLIGMLYNTMDEFRIEIKKEDRQFYVVETIQVQ